MKNSNFSNVANISIIVRFYNEDSSIQASYGNGIQIDLDTHNSLSLEESIKCELIAKQLSLDVIQIIKESLPEFIESLNASTT